MSSPAWRSRRPEQRPVIYGRDRERALLRQLLDDAIAGRGSLALITGEAGIGKTTLVQEITNSAANQGALVLTGHCYDLSTTPPYGPWLQIIRASPRIEGLPSLSEITRGSSEDKTSQGRGDELFAWGRELFEKLAERWPLVLILEDIHWADRASLDFLRFLGRNAGDVPALLIATFRGNEIEPGHSLYALLPSIIRESQPERIDLHPLDELPMSRWIASSYSLPATDSERLTTYVQRHAEGNPFFAGEILRELEEEGVLFPADGKWSLGDLHHVSVPILLRQVLETRLQRVAPKTREALALASIIGQDVSIYLWQRLADLSDSELLEIAEQASKAVLINLSSDGQQLSFRHALIRDALYEDILPLRRRILHKQVAEALLDASDPDPDALAHHLQHASDPRAAEWLIKAGDRAYYQAYSLQTAVARYQSALEALPGDAGEERGWLLVQLAQAVRYLDPKAGVRYADEAVEIALSLENRPLYAVALRNRGILRVYAGENALDDLLNGYDLIDALTDVETCRLRSKRQGQRIDTDLGRQQMALWYATMGRFEEALETNQRSFAMLDADSPTSGSHAAILHWGAGLTYASLGDPMRAGRAFQRSRDVFRAKKQDFHAGNVAAYELKYVTLPYFTDDLQQRKVKEYELRAFGQNDLSGVTNDPPDVLLCPIYLIDGRWDELQRIEEESQYVAKSVFFLFAAQMELAEFLRCTSRFNEAMSYILDFLPLGPQADPNEIQFRFSEALDLQRIAANLAIDEGRLDEARPWIDSRGRWLDISGRKIGQAEQAMLEARYAIVTDDISRARGWSLEAIRHAEDPRQPLSLLQAHRIHGEALTMLGEYEQAEDSLCCAMDLARACEAPYEQALVHLALANLHIAAEDFASSRRELRRANRTFERLGAEPALKRAMTIQDRLDAISGQSRRDTAGLSDREIEVLHLVADGLTDREIGEQLFISPRTVGQHMRSVFNKLGVNTRAAAAVKATELELLQRNDA